MTSYEYRSQDLAGHDTYSTLGDVRDALERSGKLGEYEPRIERREVGPWEECTITSEPSR